MANTLTTAINQLISIIKTQYPRFKDSGRIDFTKRIELENLGYEDAIIIKPQPTETAINLHPESKIVNHIISLFYYKKLYIDELDTVSDFAESLDSHLLTKIYQNGYWTHLDTEINYEPDIPEKYEGKLDGFEMIITFIVYKS